MNIKSWCIGRRSTATMDALVARCVQRRGAPFTYTAQDGGSFTYRTWAQLQGRLQAMLEEDDCRHGRAG